jgi:hypothetical protein
MKISLGILIIFLSASGLRAQLIPDPELPPALLTKKWESHWVRVPDTDPRGYGVYLFRNSLELERVPESFRIHISADNRYKLFVNGRWIGLGPARSDTDNWIFETYDLAQWMNEGTNTIAVLVWNMGMLKPWAQHSLYTGLIIQGNGAAESTLNTPGSWRCIQNHGIDPVVYDTDSVTHFIVVGARDHVNVEQYPLDWKSDSFDDSHWLFPETIVRGTPRGVGTQINHALVPRKIPAMELTSVDPPSLRTIVKGTSVPGIVPKGFLQNITIPANTSITLLLDQGKLINGYPSLTFSGGDSGMIRIRYDEALFTDKGTKIHRDSISGLRSRGYYDEIVPDGRHMTFTPLWIRTFRYITLEVKTDSEPLVIHGLDMLFSGYPFDENASFESGDSSLQAIWETGWHTSRLCANEVFYDCPYYEQMQYVGDARIQALISLYVSGDDRLMRKAIDDFFHSMTPDGLTMSRYPSEPGQIIPTYSLFWVSMIHDYLLHRPDYAFTAGYLTSVQRVLRWFENRIDPQSGMVGPVEWWPFVDWTTEWREGGLGGVPPGGVTGNSSVITLQYAMTLQEAADIFTFYGLNVLSDSYLHLADSLIAATRKHCWSSERQLLADTPGKSSFSQHANALAVLTGAVPEKDRAVLMDRSLKDPSLTQASFYFRFYVHRAMVRAGLGDKLLNELDKWNRMISYGLTTFPETSDLNRTRSDCHAWSASPLFELLATVAGIRPAETGFRQVFIEPHPGTLEWLRATVPHPGGEIAVDLRFRRGTVRGTVTLPPQTPGLFIWKGRTLDLKPGIQTIEIKDPDRVNR